MIDLGRQVSTFLSGEMVLCLEGDLGAGKTTLVKVLLQGLGYHGAVTSPTYTLVEPYECNGLRIFHFDLYRIKDPYELEMLGIRDMLGPDTVCLFEWPDRAGNLLPKPDGIIEIAYAGEGRSVSFHGAFFEKNIPGMELV